MSGGFRLRLGGSVALRLRSSRHAALRSTVSARRPQTEAEVLIFSTPSGVVRLDAPTIPVCGQLPQPVQIPLATR
jgi:hypothetical protein